MKALITSSCQGPAGNHLEAGEVHDLTNEQIGDLRGRVSLDKDAIKAAEEAALKSAKAAKAAEAAAIKAAEEAKKAAEEAAKKAAEEEKAK